MPGPFSLTRALIAVSGPDARSFLDNLLTQNLAGLDQAGVLYGALLTPQGKVLADAFIWARDGGVVLDADPARAEALLTRLRMYKLRADVEIADVSNGALRVLVSDAPFDGARPDPRLAALGWRGLGESAAAAGDGAFAALCLQHGVPDLARDAAADEVFALEALLEELNGVDFHKGCFVGQENVSRMKRRATTRKKFCPVSFDGPALDYATPIFAGEAELGAIRGGGDGRAMALLRLDRAQAAIAKGDALVAAGREIQLDPPAWLLLPGTPD